MTVTGLSHKIPDNPRQAGDLQQRSGLAVHEHRVHRRSPAREDRHQHGRKRLLARQCVRGAPMALGEIRGGVPQPLRLGPRSPRRHRPLSGVLQCRPTAFRAWRPNAWPDILPTAASRSGMINQRQSTYPSREHAQTNRAISMSKHRQFPAYSDALRMRRLRFDAC